MNRNNIKVIIGGPLGILAWSASAGTMLIVFIWGLEKSVFAVVAVKTVSWGMWGVGVIRQSSYFKSLKNPHNVLNHGKKSLSSLSWGFTFYLCSIGDQGRLNYNLLPVSLRLYREYYVPSQYQPSPFAHGYFRVSERLMRDSLGREQSPEFVLMPQSLRGG
ncbi:hypothetical protein [Nitrosococcus wardiae]|nr:hypothetical protein [Nitrosococcus wardiae]